MGLIRAITGAATVLGGIMAVLIIGEKAGLSIDEISTICTVYTGGARLMTLLIGISQALRIISAIS